VVAHLPELDMHMRVLIGWFDIRGNSAQTLGLWISVSFYLAWNYFASNHLENVPFGLVLLELSSHWKVVWCHRIAAHRWWTSLESIRQTGPLWYLSSTIASLLWE
jgi:hypothetical protein